MKSNARSDSATTAQSGGIGPGYEKRVNVLGVGISAINLPLAVKLVAERLDAGQKGYVTVTGVHGVTEAQSDPEFREILNRSFLCTPDGMPMSWLGWWHGHKEMDRVYGPDLMQSIMAWSQDRECRHFLYGGPPGLASELQRCLEEKYPGVQIVGVDTPPFRPLNAAEESALENRMRELKPDIFWVGLSTPKQERFMARYLARLDVKLMFGVGAAFDFHAGRVKQAPRWIQRCGMEWAFRISQEPRRLWKRYLTNNPRFILRTAAQLLKIRDYPLT